MQHALESEVSKLADEVSRLRILVNRCLEEPAVQRDERVGTKPTADSAPYAAAAVIPHLFSGRDGTKRLFRLLMEAYPWLTPDEVVASREEEQRRRKFADQFRAATVAPTREQLDAAGMALAADEPPQLPPTLASNPPSQPPSRMATPRGPSAATPRTPYGAAAAATSPSLGGFGSDEGLGGLLIRPTGGAKKPQPKTKRAAAVAVLGPSDSDEDAAAAVKADPLSATATAPPDVDF